MWVFAVMVSVVAAVNYCVCYVPSLATCAVFNIHPASLVIFVVPEAVCFVLLLLASASGSSGQTSLSMVYRILQIGKRDRLTEVLME